MKNAGIEATRHDDAARPQDASAGTSRSTASHNTQQGRCRSARSRPASRCYVNGTGANRDSVGFPVRGWYYRTYTYADSNSDGFIVPSEVIVDPTFRYVGQLDPEGHRLDQQRVRSVQSKAAHQRAVRLQGRLLDHQRHVLVPVRQQSGVPRSVESERVARRIRRRRWRSRRRIRRPSFGYLENGQFWRFRELSATCQRSGVASLRRVARVERVAEPSARATSRSGRSTRAPIRKRTSHRRRPEHLRHVGSAPVLHAASQPPLLTHRGRRHDDA